MSSTATTILSADAMSNFDLACYLFAAFCTGMGVGVCIVGEGCVRRFRRVLQKHFDNPTTEQIIDEAMQ